MEKKIMSTKAGTKFKVKILIFILFVVLFNMFTKSIDNKEKEPLLCYMASEWEQVC